MRKNGVGQTQGGSKLLTAAEAEWLASQFIAILRSKASGLPESVAAHFASLDHGGASEFAEGFFTVPIYFGDDLSRPSLFDVFTDAPTGEGIDNIVALFNNGANASGRVFGFWDGHDLGPVWSVPTRPALGFMQAAKSDFEGAYGGAYGAYIILGGDYD